MKHKYLIRFEFLHDGQWHEDCLTNNGAGFELTDAEYIMQDLNARATIRLARYEKL